MTDLDDARNAPATARNREPILAVLREILPSQGTVLEIASGTGEHAVHFAAGLDHLTWQPSDPDAEARRSIAAHAASGRLANVRPPLELDASAAVWPITHADAIVSINMIHIAPWTAAEGLMAGAERLLAPGRPLFLYGPYREGDRALAPTNAAFDTSLKSRDPAWGLRELDDVTALARRHGLSLERRIEMPANNLSLVFRRNP